MLKKRLGLFRASRLLILLFLIVFLIIFIISRYFSRSVDSYIVTNVKNYVEDIIADSIETNIIAQMGDSDFMIESYDSDGYVRYAYINTKKINSLRNDVTKYINNIVDNIATDKDITSVSIPLGYFFGINLIFNNSIAIPLRLEALGNQDVDIKKEATSIGINTTILEIYFVISIDIRIVMPFKVKVMNIITNIPIAIEIMNNDVPYYLS